MTHESILDAVPADQPAFERARHLQEAAASVGFDWPDGAAVWRKVREEVDELDAALTEADQPHIQEELGDVLFALVNLARRQHIDLFAALESTNQKFIDRFSGMERAARQAGSDLSQESLALQLQRYRQAKAECLDH